MLIKRNNTRLHVMYQYHQKKAYATGSKVEKREERRGRKEAGRRAGKARMGATAVPRQRTLSSVLSVAKTNKVRAISKLNANCV